MDPEPWMIKIRNAHNRTRYISWGGEVADHLNTKLLAEGGGVCDGGDDDQILESHNDGCASMVEWRWT